MAQSIPTINGWYNPRPQHQRPIFKQLSLFCTACNLKFNNNTAFKIHLNSEKHKRHSSPTIYSCELCNIVCPGQEQLDAHLNGSKHSKKLKAKECMAVDGEQATLSPKICEDVEPLEIVGLLHCQMCGTNCSSEIQYNQHIKGRKHRQKMLALRNKVLRVQVQHNIDLPCDFNDFKPCYHSLTTDPNCESIVQKEKALLGQFNTDLNFSIRFACLFNLPDPFTSIEVSPDPSLPPISPQQFTNGHDFKNLCNHDDCAQKRAIAFYSAWIDFQKVFTGRFFELKQRQRELKRPKNTEEEGPSSSDVSMDHSHCESQQQQTCEAETQQLQTNAPTLIA
ncbi:hypothetical protein Ciccas_003800 [Cichlidogyrus casuarinus]|uniref:C2H2-type domain-containing protein n=1 Tax=Cichlidogyrus casuarinus TaxID=1844966 RepID=A0ABD2QDI2_9PLAT